MFKDETWKYEIGKKDQIIALFTKVAELKAKHKNQGKQVVALERTLLMILEMEVKFALIVQREMQTPSQLSIWPRNRTKWLMHDKYYFWCTGNDVSQFSVRYEYVLLARPAKARRSTCT